MATLRDGGGHSADMAMAMADEDGGGGGEFDFIPTSRGFGDFRYDAEGDEEEDGALWSSKEEAYSESGRPAPAFHESATVNKSIAALFVFCEKFRKSFFRNFFPSF